MRHIKTILFLFIGYGLLGCNMDVKKAHALTDPPKVEKSNFKSSQIRGHFSATSTLMFLWPEKVFDASSNKWLPMTFSQKAESRKTIVSLGDEKDLYEAQFLQAKKALDLKYSKLLEGLIQLYQKDKCYSLCDVDDFTCEPDNPNVLFQDTWKTPDNSEEEALIAQCQENESKRREVGLTKIQEAEDTVIPLQKKAGATALALLNAIGDRNFFNDVSGFELKYAPLVNSCFADGDCLKNTTEKMGLLVRVHFNGGTFSNAYDDGSLFPVSDIELNEEEGFLTFSIPAVRFEEDSRVYGEIVFDLELNPGIGKMVVSGDIRLKNFDDGTERIGRIASGGPLVGL